MLCVPTVQSHSYFGCFLVIHSLDFLVFGWLYSMLINLDQLLNKKKKNWTGGGNAILT